jgi:hypothetical protein
MSKLIPALFLSVTALAVSIPIFLRIVGQSPRSTLPAGELVAPADLPRTTKKEIAPELAAADQTELSARAKRGELASRETSAASPRLTHRTPVFAETGNSANQFSSQSSGRVSQSLASSDAIGRSRQAVASAFPIPSEREFGGMNHTRSARAESVTLELDPGIQVPAALIESDEPLPPAEAAANEQIAQDFEREISEAVRTSSGTDPNAIHHTWAEATERANQRYKMMFGFAAFNRASVNAGLDATENP